MKKLPKHCQGQSMGFFDTAKAYLGRFVQLPHDECFEFHKALRATPHAQVTPVQVDFLLRFLSNIITFFQRLYP
jgi:hypothetical protein